MITNKRGISPLIATVLIVGFTIILAVIVVNFVLNTTESQTEQQACQSEAEQACLLFVGADKVGLSAVTATAGTVDTVTISNLASEATDFVVTAVDSAGATKGVPFTTPNVATGGTTNVDEDDWTIGADGLVAGDTIRVIPLIDRTVEGVTCSATCTAAAQETVVL